MPKRSRDYRTGLAGRLKDRLHAAEYLMWAAKESDAGFLLALRDVAESWGIVSALKSETGGKG